MLKRMSKVSEPEYRELQVLFRKTLDGTTNGFRRIEEAQFDFVSLEQMLQGGFQLSPGLSSISPPGNSNIYKGIWPFTRKQELMPVFFDRNNC